MRKVILEVRCNEYAMRDENPNVPWSPEEIAADAAKCREAGAAVLHYHAREPETGAPSNDAALYGETIRRVREATDLVITPTLGATTIADPIERISHIPILAKDPATRPDFAPLDLATTNIDPYVSGRGFAVDDLIYPNPVAGIRGQLAQLAPTGVRPEAVLWNVGSARLLDALLETGDFREPVFAEVVLSDLLRSCHPATERGLDALIDFLPQGRRLEWLALVVGGSVLHLAPIVLARGGHLAIGLGDFSFTELGTPTNAELVARLAREVRASGAEIATPDEARELMGLV